MYRCVVEPSTTTAAASTTGTTVSIVRSKWSTVRSAGTAAATFSGLSVCARTGSLITVESSTYLWCRIEWILVIGGPGDTRAAPVTINNSKCTVSKVCCCKIGVSVYITSTSASTAIRSVIISKPPAPPPATSKNSAWFNRAGIYQRKLFQEM